MPLDYSSRFIGVNGERQLARFAEVTKNTKTRFFRNTAFPGAQGWDGVIVGWGDHGLSEETSGRPKIESDRRNRGQCESTPGDRLSAGIKILNTSEIIGDYVAEHTLALILSWLRRITFDRQMKQGAFADGSWMISM